MKKNSITFGLLFSLILFLGLTYVAKIYKVSDLPLQIVGALLGSVATAVITYFLLVGQTSSEEKKERNVKVYETKSTLYQPIIEKLWGIYEDQNISIFEIDELFDAICKNVVLYLDAEKTNQIFKIVRELTEFASDKTINQANLKDQIQDHIFSIINILAHDIDLGGNLTYEAKQNIKWIQDKIYEAKKSS